MIRIDAGDIAVIYVKIILCSLCMQYRTYFALSLFLSWYNVEYLLLWLAITLRIWIESEESNGCFP